MSSGLGYRICVALVSATAALGWSAERPVRAQPALSSTEPFRYPTEEEREFPRLPEGFAEREIIAPDALLAIVLEGFTGLVFQDNVFRAPSGTEKSDFLWIAAPRARLIHDGPQIDAELVLEAEIGRYFDEKVNDYDDFGGRAEAIWGDRNAEFARIRGELNRNHQAIGADVDTPDRQAADVTKFWENELRLDGAALFGRFMAAPEFRYRALDYRDVDRLDGTRIQNDGKDRTELDGVVRLGVEVEPQLWVVVDPVLNARYYEEGKDLTTNTFDRDSVGGRLRAGLRYGVPGAPLQAVLTAGWAVQDYDDDRLRTVDTFGFLGRLEWRIRPDTALDVDVERDIGETTLSGASGTISTRGRARLLHMLTPDLNLQIAGEIERRDFEINRDLRPDDRTDKIYKLGAEANYMFTRFGFAGLAIDYVERDSNDPTVRFDALEVSARVGARF